MLISLVGFAPSTGCGLLPPLSHEIEKRICVHHQPLDLPLRSCDLGNSSDNGFHLRQSCTDSTDDERALFPAPHY
jgi:hypothetical protein